MRVRLHLSSVDDHTPPASPFLNGGSLRLEGELLHCLHSKLHTGILEQPEEHKDASVQTLLALNESVKQKINM